MAKKKILDSNVRLKKCPCFQESVSGLRCSNIKCALNTTLKARYTDDFSGDFCCDFKRDSAAI